MPADLDEKVKRYEDMLKRALQKAKYSPIPASHMYAVAKDYYTMGCIFWRIKTL